MKLAYLIENQKADGCFGPFHSMRNHQTLTTEKALRRFHALNLTKDTLVVKNTLSYVRKCLQGELQIPDKEEKVINWQVFEALMFSSWLKLFDDETADVISQQNIWKMLIQASIVNGRFDDHLYRQTYRQMFIKKQPKERVINPCAFYPVVLLSTCLEQAYHKPYFDALMNKGIYYIYDQPLTMVPKKFDSMTTIRYLEAIKLIIGYCPDKQALNFVLTWLKRHQNKDGSWTMDELKPDGIIFPRSEHWRKKETKTLDINAYMKEVLRLLET